MLCYVCLVMACRSLEKCKSAAEKLGKQAGRSVTAMQCDLASLRSVLEFTARFKEKYDSIDSIILNAGLGGIPFSKTTDGIEMQIGKTNAVHGRASICSRESNKHNIYCRDKPLWPLSANPRASSPVARCGEEERDGDGGGCF